MPGDLFSGPLFPVEIISIMATMANFLFIMLSRVVRRQAGPTTIDLGQTTLGMIWEWGLFALFVLLAFVPALDMTPSDRELFLVVRLLPVAMFLISILVAHALGVRPGRRELAERGLVQGGWRLTPWEDLTAHRWQARLPSALQLTFGQRTTVVIVPKPHEDDVDLFLRNVAPSPSGRGPGRG